MKRIFPFLFCVVSMLIAIFFSKRLPADTHPLVAKKYGYWTGVIRVWSADPDSARWLDACARNIERAHSGIYINIRTVSAETLLAYADSGIEPPDIIVYPSTISPDIKALSPAATSYPLRDGLKQTAYATPLLIRPRFLIYKSEKPDTSDGSPIACAEADLTALTILSAGSDRASHIDVVTDASPRKSLLNGEAAALVGGIDDVLYLSDRIDIEANLAGEYMTGDTVMCSVVRKDDGRAEACLEYLDVLLGEGQILAARALAFPAVSGVSAWESNGILTAVEALSDGLVWLDTANADPTHARLYIEGNISADEAVRLISGS